MLAVAAVVGQAFGQVPGKTVNIKDAGAVGDGKTINTTTIQKTIDTLSEQGGGTIVIPAPTGEDGAFVTGALFLKTGVNVHFEKGAILKGSTDVKDYPTTRTRIEGHFQDWLPALINAVEVDHLKIDGEGTMDGSGTPFYAAFRAARGAKNLDVPRPRLLFIQHSKDVEISNIKLQNSGFWNLHIYNCDGVTVDGLDISAPMGSPSTDGIDVDSSRNITIKNTTIANNDDCIALKGTKGVNAASDKDSPPVEHIRISNVTCLRGGALVTCGSEATLVRDVVVEHCKIGPGAVGGISMLRLKLRTDTPQHYEDIHYKDITLDNTGGRATDGALFSVAPWSQYEDLQGQPRPTHSIKNISFTDIKGKFGSFGSVRGNNGDTMETLVLENIDLTLGTPPNANMLGTFKDVTVKNVKFNGVEFKLP
jgi:alpha-L-rhamnosidase